MHNTNRENHNQNKDKGREPQQYTTDIEAFQGHIIQSSGDGSTGVGTEHITINKHKTKPMNKHVNKLLLLCPCFRHYWAL